MTRSSGPPRSVGPATSEPPDVFAAAKGLQVAATAKRVFPALGAVAIERVVLKGPTIERVLYDRSAPRLYGDLDLLVNPAARAEAERSLSELGYRPGQAGWNEISRSWKPSDPSLVDIDLHQTLVGATADDLTVWRMLAENTEPFDLYGVQTLALNRPALAMHIATHAAQHGADPAPGPLEDLRRALEQFGPDTWVGALAIARAIGAEEAFGAGLRQLPAGSDLATSLGVTERASIDVAARAAERHQPMVLGIEQLRLIQGRRARIRFATGKLFPGRSQMRATYPLAGRGRAGLAAAHAVRLGSALVHLPMALVRRRRAFSRGDG